MGIILRDSNVDIIRQINNAAIRKIIKTFNRADIVAKIQELVREEVIQSIQQTSVWNNLLSGGAEGLDAHFGIPREQLEERLNSILAIWANEIEVRPQNVKRRPRTFSVSYRFYAIYANYNQVLSSPAGITINYSRKHQGQRLPWLQWLLVDGDQLTISDYHIEFGNFPRSRSGKAYMRPNFSWRVPPEFGPFSIENNFITRAMDELAENNNFKKRIIDIIVSVSFGKTSVISDDLDISNILDNI